MSGDLGARGALRAVACRTCSVRSRRSRIVRQTARTRPNGCRSRRCSTACDTRRARISRCSSGPSLDAAFQDARQRMGDEARRVGVGATAPGGVRAPAVHQRRAARACFDLPPVPRGGDATTVNNTGNVPVQVHGASFRAVMDVGDWDRSTMINVPGQSGQPGSRHYGDLLPLWAKGEYHPMLFSRDAVEQHASARLVLRPGVPASACPRPYPSAAEQQAAPRPAAPADAPPRLPPFAGTLVNFDRREGELTAACALALGGGETKRGARAVPNTHVWVFEREIMRELGSSPGTCDPAWAPDGSRLAVVTPNGLWTYTPTLDDPRQLAETSLPAEPAGRERLHGVREATLVTGRAADRLPRDQRRHDGWRPWRWRPRAACSSRRRASGVRVGRQRRHARPGRAAGHGQRAEVACAARTSTGCAAWPW